MIELIKVDKYYKSRFQRTFILKNIDFTVNEGEFVSIMGPSGAGKTTLLQIVGTLDRPDSGSVLYDGKDVFALGERDLARFRNRNIGFVFQFHQLLPEFSCRENVALPSCAEAVATTAPARLYTLMSDCAPSTMMLPSMNLTGDAIVISSTPEVLLWVIWALAIHKPSSTVMYATRH